MKVDEAKRNMYLVDLEGRKGIHRV